MKEVTLPSGAKLEITLSPFAEAKALYQAVLEELRSVSLDANVDVLDPDLLKNLLCVGLASKKIEAAVKVCMKRAVYNGSRIDDATWEPIEARGDYIFACMEVAKANIDPFVRSLYAEYSEVLKTLLSGPASRQPTTPLSSTSDS